MDLEQVKKEVHKCRKCNLYEFKQNYVFGEGTATAPIVFVGEAPGAREDKVGQPFVGSSGRIFDELLRSIELEREGVYICNVLKCHPPDNRNPDLREIDSCSPYLKLQLEIIKPKIVCPMGNFAVGFVLKKYGLSDKVNGISKLHGKIFKVTNLFEKIKIIPLYHPAVAGYNPDMKKVLLNDIKIVKGELNDKQMD